MRANSKIIINTYSKVVESFTHLDKGVVMSGMDIGKAVLYFQVLLDEEENGIIERPHFTFAIEDFSKYIRFFKRHNFLDSGFNRNTFKLSKNWWDKAVTYTIPLYLEDELLQAVKELPELKKYLFISE